MEQKYKKVKIFPTAKIPVIENVEIGEYSEIGDFSFIYSKKVKIGRYVHISPYASIAGCGEVYIGDYCVISYGARLLSSTDYYVDEDGPKRMSTVLPDSHRCKNQGGKIIMHRDSFVASNAVVMPNVEIGEGAILGALGFAKKGMILKPWTIYAGAPAKPIGKRPKVTLPGI